MREFDELAAAEAQLADLLANARFAGRDGALHSQESHSDAVASAQAYVDAIKARPKTK